MNNDEGHDMEDFNKVKGKNNSKRIGYPKMMEDMNLNSLHVLIPNSLLEETSDPKIAVYKLGQIARSCSIFRVNHIWVYDSGGSAGDFISEILKYAETPPYLRKVLFDRSSYFENAGVLPPLQTPHHNKYREPEVGEIREGVFLWEKDGEWRVNVGLKRPAVFDGDGFENSRDTFKVVETDPLMVERSDPPENEYWGYDVHFPEIELDETLKRMTLDHIMATSRYGEDVRGLKLSPKVRDLGIVFGSPKEGIPEIESRPGLFGSVVNSIPDQSTKTVRTEEAVIATLSILNLWRG